MQARAGEGRRPVAALSVTFAVPPAGLGWRAMALERLVQDQEAPLFGKRLRSRPLRPSRKRLASKRNGNVRQHRATHRSCLQ
jgi:hypothetical protein